MAVFRVMQMMLLKLFWPVIWLMILMQSAITTIMKKDTNAATMAVVAETVTSKYGYNVCKPTKISGFIRQLPAGFVFLKK
jgi:hypothetical protein